MVELFICGDIVNYKNTDGLIVSESLSNIISKADYSICNFEAPIEGYGSPIVKSGIHHYQKKSTIKGLKSQGFDLLCLANNHILDFGKKGLEGTLEEAHKEKLDTIGAGLNFKNAYTPLIKEINNLKIGFINACESQFGVLDYYQAENVAGYGWINHSEVDKQILSLSKKCDFVIVLSHAGLENYPLPQKEWRYRYKHLCDLGADLVIGSHPHVPQGYEYYNDSIIFYSLGNFYFDSKNYIDKKDNSYSLQINLYQNGEIKFNPIYHYKNDCKVHLASKNEQVDLEKLNGYLEEEYTFLHNQMILEVYNSRLKKNLILSLLPIPYDGTIYSSFKRVLNKMLGRIKNDNKDISALHLLRNETYHYVFKHALEIISEKNAREKNE